MHLIYLCCSAALAAVIVTGQSLPSSFPHNYPGIPNTQGNFSDSIAWQQYFEVKTPLPNITFPLTRSYAGNLPVNRQGHSNNTLFFWGFEKTNGSLNSNNSQEPWIVWLNGGPGSSSMLGLLLENGPIHFNGDFTAYSNNYSWNRLADTFWIDQPVGTGWSTADNTSFVTDEDEVGRDFLGFLSNLVQVFPTLAHRPLYLAGESYAGTYIPYIAKTYFSMLSRPVRILGIAMGDGDYAGQVIGTQTTVVSVIETYPQLVGYSTDVLAYFKEQAHLCKLDVNLTYPQLTPVPPVMATVPLSSSARGRLAQRKISFFRQVSSSTSETTLAKKSFVPREQDPVATWISKHSHGTIDAWYGCDLFDEMVDFALNFSKPWRGNSIQGFNFYNIPDALCPEAPPTLDSVGAFLNDPRVVAAIHAPNSKNWTAAFAARGYPFGGGSAGDPSPEPSVFFSELFRNLSVNNIKPVLYSGNADALLPHFGTEIVIQNTTLGPENTRGFTRKLATPWSDDDGVYAGLIHTEYNVTYALFDGAGHLVPQVKPKAAFTFLREFVLGANPLGTVLPNGTVVGGETGELANDILSAESSAIFFGSGTTQGSTVYPSATIAAWNRFVSAANARPTASKKMISAITCLSVLMAICSTLRCL